MFHRGDVIKKLRRRRGWTIQQLAKVSGVNKATISGLERGEGNPQEDTIRKLAVALGTTAPELYAATAQPAPDVRGRAPTPEESREVDLIGVFRQLDAEEQKDVCGYARHKLWDQQQRRAGADDALAQ